MRRLRPHDCQRQDGENGNKQPLHYGSFMLRPQCRRESTVITDRSVGARETKGGSLAILVRSSSVTFPRHSRKPLVNSRCAFVFFLSVARARRFTLDANQIRRLIHSDETCERDEHLTNLKSQRRLAHETTNPNEGSPMFG